jgi:ParB-like chromosome segregation protein Spo0J
MGTPRRDAIEGSEPAMAIELALVRTGRSPRAQPIDDAHVELLRSCIDSVPPVVLQAANLTIIDGAHRVLAARREGRTTIRAVLFEGTAEQAFREAVRHNVAHGKPLTRAEREQAAAEILQGAPELSDRSIADVCGLSPDAIVRVRRASTSEEPTHRLGRDGRRRPVDPTLGRVRVAELLAREPHVSDRQAATKAGVSQGTARDVRRRLTKGESPIPPASREPVRAHSSPTDWSDDSALRNGRDGQAFAQWMDGHSVKPDEWRRWPAAVPVGRLYAVADEARRQAREWSAFADALEARAR